MKEEGSGEHFRGKLIANISPEQLARSTLAFVYKQLPSWRDAPDRPKEDSEPKLNLQLCKYLASQARNNFPMVRFDHEEYQQGRRSVDLSASPAESVPIGAKLYTIYDPFLVLECKRLPAPSKDREREYVTGDTKSSGGIQRFKLGLHGGKLDLVAMIGYIQDRGVQHWHRTINQWISSLSLGGIGDGCVWGGNERLGAFEEDTTVGTARCRSVHARTGRVASNRVDIRHLWVVMGEGD